MRTNQCIYQTVIVELSELYNKIIDNVLLLHKSSLRLTGAGLGVHLMPRISFSFSLLFAPFPPQLLALLIASARRTRAMPVAVRSSRFFAAGVKRPGMSDFLTDGVIGVRGVHDGGAMSPFLRGVEKMPEDDDERRILFPRRDALAFMFLAASPASLCDRVSRFDGSGKWNGVFGSSRESSEERMRGVAFRVPHVISCLMAAGPSSSGFAEGTAGSNVVFDGGERG